MGSELTTLVNIDFRSFKFSQMQRGMFNEMSMTLPQYSSLIRFLNEAKPEIEKIISLTSEPDTRDMEMMDVKREQVSYRQITISVTLDEKTHLPLDWKYDVVYLTKGKDGNPAMAFGDTGYTRDDIRAKK